jgi:hypothetical protein
MDVKVTANPSVGGTDWAIDDKPPKHSVIVFGNQAGQQEIKFKLNDHTKRGWRFNRADPIWVHETEADICPGAGIDTDQIKVASCGDKQLVIGNANSGDPRTLHYQLNFVDRTGAHEGVDPVIKNGGGTRL